MVVFVVLRRALNGSETRNAVQKVYLSRSSANKHARYANYGSSAYRYWVVRKEVTE